MVIYPAIDIMGGRCVRLIQGRFDKETVYSDDPCMTAKQWEKMGAEYLHVVDLDGARTGEPVNLPLIIKIAAEVGIPVQTGGGIRTLKTIETVLKGGVKRVILGTSAVENRDFVKEALRNFGKEAIVVGIDAKDGMVATDGWVKTSGINAVEFAKEMHGLGVATIIYTDIARDGMLLGPNFSAIENMVKSLPDVDVIASGGVSCINDICRLKAIGASGTIIGKALYTGDIDLKEALEIGKSEIDKIDIKLPYELKFDQRGLIPAIVQDYFTNEVLMLAYMNHESLELTLKSGIAHYWSRSRNKLWKKGETSGHYQYVKSIHVDCDCDTLLLKVHQEGVACHTGNYSCFYRKLSEFERGDQ